RRDDVRMERQPQVIVRPEHERGAAVDDDFARADHALDDGQARHRRARLEFAQPAVNRAQLVEQIHHYSAFSGHASESTLALPRSATKTPRSYRALVAARCTLPLVV